MSHRHERPGSRQRTGNAHGRTVPASPRPAVDALPLSHRLFLLSHRPANGRLDDDSAAVRGSLLAGAAAADLCLTGWLRDRNGRAERTGATPATRLDPFLAQMLGDVPPDRSRRWFDVLERGWPRAEEVVRDHLAAAGLITVGSHRVLGLVRTDRIGVPDPGPVHALRDRVREAARGTAGPAPARIEEAVLAVLAIDGDVSTVFGWRDLWGHKPAVRALKDRIGRDLPGLRSAWTDSIALRRTM